MSFSNSLYFIESAQSDHESHGGMPAKYTVRFDAGHPVFKGHFPNRPVVPGACLVQIAEELASSALGGHVRFMGLTGLKFRQLVTPEQQIVYCLDFDNKSVKVKISLTEQTCAQFTASYMRLDSDLQ